MKLYDLTFWIKIDKNPEEVMAEVKGLIEKSGAQLEFDLGYKKKQMAYPINKETVGYLATLLFRAEPEIAEKINKELKKIQGILRYLIVKRKTLPKAVTLNKELAETKEEEKVVSEKK